MQYHEVSRIILDGYKKLGDNREDKLFKEYLERIEVIYTAIYLQYDQAPNGFEPPSLAYNAPIVGLAEDLVKDLQVWINQL